MKSLAAVTSPPTSRRSTPPPAAPDQLIGAHERGVGMRADRRIRRAFGWQPYVDVGWAARLCTWLRRMP
jgi:hypothetical protein